jgi:hypothetical protein
MQRLCLRFTVGSIMLAVAVAALVLGIFMACLLWARYPHIKVTIFNESSATISDVRVKFLYGERTAKRVRPGGIAVTEIQSGGDAGIFLSYRNSDGVLYEAEPLYYESGNRGFLELHVTDGGGRMVNGIYAGGDLGVWNLHLSPKGGMTVR